MKQIEMFAQTQKRAKLEQVAENSPRWMDRALWVIDHSGDTLSGFNLTGEDVRRIVESHIGPPHHHNAYGALIMKALKRGYLVPTGKWVPMKGPKSNARRTPQYRLVSK